MTRPQAAAFVVGAGMVVFAGALLGVSPAAWASGHTTTPPAACDTAKGACCGGVQTSIIGGEFCAGVNDTGKELKDSAIWKLLIVAINILTAGIGIAAVGGIVYASFLYTTAGDKADQTRKAVSLIFNVAVGIIAYGLMYVFLNFLIPGGIFT